MPRAGTKRLKAITLPYIGRYMNTTSHATGSSTIRYISQLRLMLRQVQRPLDQVLRRLAGRSAERGADCTSGSDIGAAVGLRGRLSPAGKCRWLAGRPLSGLPPMPSTKRGACRILSNARCLSEGIDVPALDAVLFMSPRNSQVDIVQAVGRAMLKAPGKRYGYIVLPVAVPAGVDPAAALDDNERFAAVWGVLRALRSHDDRFDAEINKIDLNDTPTNRIIFGGDGIGEDDDSPSAPELPFPPLDLPPGAIFAKIVDKCGDRKYWETWATDVADIFSRLVYRIGALLENAENAALREWFQISRRDTKKHPLGQSRGDRPQRSGGPGCDRRAVTGRYRPAAVRGMMPDSHESLQCRT